MPVAALSTPSAPVLTADQARSFAEDGYLVVPDLITAAEVATHNANLSRLVRESDDQGRHPAPGVSVQFERGFAAAGRSVEERELAVRKFFQFGPADAFFWASVRDARIRAILDGLLGPGARLLQSMAMVKPPGIGSPKEWHQDIPYFAIGGTAADCLGVWIATDDATLENGCIQVVPGSHRQGPVPHVEGPTGWRLSDERVAAFADRVRPVPVRAGSALVFSSALFHFSDHNRSPRRRRALQYHYVSAAVRAGGLELADLDSPAPPRLAAALR